MKALFLPFIALSILAVAEAYILFDAEGFFPVVVQVVRAGTGQPIAGAQVQLGDVGTYKEMDLDPKMNRKVYGDDLGTPTATDKRGIAVVTYFTRYGGKIEGDKRTVSLPICGTLTVKVEGKEVYRKALREWAEEAEYMPSPDSAPRIVVEVQATDANQPNKTQ